MDKISVFCETLALFSSECPDFQDEINVLTGDVVVKTNEEGMQKTLYPTPFYFDFADVIALNPSESSGYCSIAFLHDRYTIKMMYKDAVVLFKKSRGIDDNVWFGSDVKC